MEKRSDCERTAVAITADHGELLGDAEMLYKGCFLEGAIHVPWIYREPTCMGRTKGVQTLTPLPLTHLLKRTMRNLKDGGGAKVLRKWANQQKCVIVEFGRERLLISGNRKLALDEMGKPAWAVHLGRDINEQVNIIKQQRYQWLLSPNWWVMRIWGKYITRMRSRDRWVWRDLRSNN